MRLKTSAMLAGLELGHTDLDVHKTLASAEIQMREAARAFCRRDKEQGDE